MASVLQGYNGTIFAYGQTGSGKTFTITGGVERYADRGIIPRTLSFMFDYCKRVRVLGCCQHRSYQSTSNLSFSTPSVDFVFNMSLSPFVSAFVGAHRTTVTTLMDR